MTNGNPPAGWYRDPTAQADGRYWDGANWTDTVTRGGVNVQSPMDPNLQQVPPVPGTQLGGQATRPAAAPAQPSSRSSSTMTILGFVFVIAIALVVLLLVFGGEDSSDDPAPPEPPPVTAPATTAPPTTAAPATSAP